MRKKIESCSLSRLFEILAILGAAATFFLQVTTRTKIAAVTPYAIMAWGCAACLSASSRQGNRRSPIPQDAWVGIYFAIVCGKLFVRFEEGGSFAALAADGFNFVAPAVFYWYYRRKTERAQGDGLLLGLIGAGIFSAVFFVYDSAFRSLTNDVPAFAKSAHQYSMAAMQFDAEQMNLARISPGSRAMGAMVSHSHSATWIALGGFAAFTWFQERCFKGIFLTVLLVLAVGMNYTGILSFVAVTILCYKSPLLAQRGDRIMLDRRVLSRRLHLAILIGALLIGVVILGGALGAKIIRVIGEQTAFIFAPGAGLPFSYADLTRRNVIDYLGNLRGNLGLLLAGAIPSADSSWPIGGDTGFLDSLSFLGVPLWLLSIGFFVSVFLRRGRYVILPDQQWGQVDDRARLRFLVAVVLFLLIMDAHYNVWLNKSIQIALFASLGYGVTRQAAGDGVHGP